MRGGTPHLEVIKNEIILTDGQAIGSHEIAKAYYQAAIIKWIYIALYKSKLFFSYSVDII